MSEMSLPEHWKTEKLGQLCRVFSGYGFKTLDYTKKGIPLIKIGNLQDGEVVINPDNDYMPESWQQKEQLQKFILKSRDILIALTGATTGKTAVVSPNLAGTFLNQRVGKIELISPDAEQDFILVAIKTRFFQEVIQQNILRSAQGNISPSSIAQIPIPLPPLPEQRAIAHVLQTIQEAKAARQRELALERERKAALMDYLFAHGTKDELRKQTEIGEIPESWEVVQIEEIGKVVTGNTPKTSVPEYYGGPYMFIAPGDISEAQYVTKTEKHVSAEGLKVLRPLPRDAVLVVCIGATIGKTAMTSVEPSVTNQQINAIIPNAKALPHYVYYAVTYRSRSLPSLAGRAAIPIVKKSIFAKFPILLPPLSEQHAIAETLQAFDIKIATLEQEAEYLDELFHAMLDELMTRQRSAVPLIDSELLN